MVRAWFNPRLTSIVYYYHSFRDILVFLFIVNIVVLVFSTRVNRFQEFFCECYIFRVNATLTKLWNSYRRPLPLCALDRDTCFADYHVRLFAT